MLETKGRCNCSNIVHPKGDFCLTSSPRCQHHPIMETLFGYHFDSPISVTEKNDFFSIGEASGGNRWLSRLARIPR
jgi:hypothetical protein